MSVFRASLVELGGAQVLTFPVIKASLYYVLDRPSNVEQQSCLELLMEPEPKREYNPQKGINREHKPWLYHAAIEGISELRRREGFSPPSLFTRRTDAPHRNAPGLFDCPTCGTRVPGPQRQVRHTRAFHGDETLDIGGIPGGGEAGEPGVSPEAKVSEGRYPQSPVIRFRTEPQVRCVLTAPPGTYTASPHITF